MLFIMTLLLIVVTNVNCTFKRFLRLLKGLVMTNKEVAERLVQDHCTSECTERGTKKCTDSCYQDLTSRVETILNDRETRSKSITEGVFA